MASLEEWTTPFLGRESKVFRTSMFHGVDCEVLVTGGELSDSHAWVSFHSEGLAKEEFDRVLRSSSLVIPGKIPSDLRICKKQGSP